MRRLISSWFLVGVCFVSAGVVLAQRASESTLSALHPSEVAVLSAVRGWSGGIVAVLSPEESFLVTRMRALGGFQQSSDAFHVLMRGVRRSPAELKAGHAQLNSAGSAFSEFAAQRAGWTAGRGNNGVAALRSTGAGFCNRILQRRLSESIEGRDIHYLMAQAVRSATGAKVPGGFLGSCQGFKEVSALPLAVQQGEVLEDALNSLVASFGGAVWVAVQSDQTCSIGLVQEAHHDGAVCLAPIVNEIR